MILEDRLYSFAHLGENLNNAIHEMNFSEDTVLSLCLNKAFDANNWFTVDNSISALKAISFMLSTESIEASINKYHRFLNAKNPKNVGIIMAGNIPAVGFQDLFHVLLAGHRAIIKTSSDDDLIIRYLVDQLIKVNIDFDKRISFVKSDFDKLDAIIATGSDNTARYFDYYFKKMPSIIRKNRNSVAVLSGNEKLCQLEKLADDVFMYFGLGCRNVSKIYIPNEFDVQKLVKAFQKYGCLSSHKYFSANYRYSKALNEFNSNEFIDCGFAILIKNLSFNSPIAQINFQTYSNIKFVEKELLENSQKLQCIVSDLKSLNLDLIEFGHTQFPNSDDFADGVNTLEFLGKL